MSYRHAFQAARNERRKAKPKGLTIEQKDELKNVFDLLDEDGGGSIDAKELKMAMWAMGFETTQDEITAMIKTVDSDNSGTVDFHEFLNLMSTHAGSLSVSEKLTKVYNLFDNDQSGSITEADVRRVARDLKETPTNESITYMLKYADVDQDGVVSLGDFVKYMRRTPLFPK
ncbi:MAG: hypothetical protein WDW38_010798 [Sanguina aurantia]